jgi:hypothetical protein
MKRTAGLMVLLAGLAGCVNDNPGPYMGSYWASQNANNAIGCAAQGPTRVPGMQGPWGQPVPMAAPYNSAPPSGEAAARAMLGLSMPLSDVQQAGYRDAGAGSSGILPAGGPPLLSPPGLPAAPPGAGFGAPPPGMPLAMGGPRVPGAVAAVGALTGPGPQPFPTQRTEIFFTGPPGMKISWFAPSPSGGAAFTPDSIEAPGRYNFLQAAIYRLKLTDIPGRNFDLYPTLEVVPANQKTADFLAHSAVPVTFTDEDFEQIASGNYVIKVIYLPDPSFQDLATTGPSEVVSSRLEPGVNPITEACRRGSILAVVRLGNIDLGLQHSPAMDAPSPYAPHPAILPGPGGPPPFGMGPALPRGPMVPPPPSGVGVLPPTGQIPVPPLPTPVAPSTPVSKLPDASTGSPLSPNVSTSKPAGSSVQQVDYKAPVPSVPTPAALASQSPGSTPADTRPAPSKWVIPGVDGKPSQP